MNSAEIGRYIRLLRKRENMSQEKLGELLNLSYQQVQKYELGQSKITIELLSKISHIFSLSMSEIIENSFREFAKETPTRSRPGAEYGNGGLLERELLLEQELIQEFRRLGTSGAKDLVLSHIKSISKLEKELSPSAADENIGKREKSGNTENGVSPHSSSGKPEFYEPYSPRRKE